MSEQPKCYACGRFVKADEASQCVEYGDYGTVHSVEYECAGCVVKKELSDECVGAER